ncbi:MAG: hypothetical protein ACLQSR_14240 [Limisphaerales bacterium]
MKEIITDSIRYWEPRRIAYNAALALVLAFSFRDSHISWAAISWALAISLLIMAVIANLFYSAVYIADIFFQMSEYRQVWKRFRWALLVVGTLFAAALFLIRQ